MRVAIIVPAHLPPATGNQVTAARLAAGLRRNGVHVTVAPAAEAAAAAAGADVLHALHARKAGVATRLAAAAARIPYSVTCTGTDVEMDLYRDAGRAEMGAVLADAGGIAVFHAGASASLRRAWPALADRIAVIPQAPVLPPPAGRSRADWGLRPTDLVFLLPAGLRPVKQPALALAPLAALQREVPCLRWLVVGPELDAGCAAAFKAAIAPHPWARYLGAVSRPALVDLYRLADVVLNTSRAEGGPNSILEAMKLGKAVLAADVPGNRALIDDGKDGLLFAGADGLAQPARRLARDALLRRRLGRRAAWRIAARHRPEAEIAAYLRLLQRARMQNRRPRWD